MTRQRVVERSDARVASACRSSPRRCRSSRIAAIRKRGTIGGSLAHADPAAELPAVMLALEARLMVSSQSGTREVAADDFFAGLFSTALEPGELLTEIRDSAAGDAQRLRVPGNVEASRRFRAGRCGRRRCSSTSRAAAPTRASRCSASAIGRCLPSRQRRRWWASGRRPRRFAPPPTPLRRSDIDPPSDIHASARYRRHLADVLTRRVLARAFESARPVDRASHWRTT